jgi:maltose alpha-D-glucosyltransferase/alpha-amylase
MKRLRTTSFTPEDRLGQNPLWYKDAIIYELRVRSFFDGNGDGIGDFVGVTSKLDYLQDLGVTAIWMLPFYPTPLRDDGYDIADYTDVHPDCGTLADFDELLAEAHKRGIRVITELVLNHTSDRHPWFRRAREAPPGSVERDFYVWSDTSDRYPDARIIFKDFEPSNWSWDPVARAYYWHRFYAHQPDLNFENPAVREALFAVVDFWFDKGVDGLRLDAVPYLYEADGTNGENLPATHAFLKELRAHIDGKYRDRMLLAEANQWPEDAAAYFGAGDECHMNFHFPIMPRMFMSIHMEDRFPILDILAQTPTIPANCQWALFLRNHDELTLEMVTDEERDYMYRAYATDTEMRINLGIRRRLAPLVGNDRRKMELLDGILLSLPGTPVLYYGDEIGMGDNVFLGDRNGVRTPMQWSSDRNAGFSRANPQRLILPVTIDPEYHYEAINVEAQQNNPNSRLWWTKRLIALRKQFRVFGRGTMRFLTPSNHRVLVFERQLDDQVVLVVANLSRHAQYVELDLSRWKGLHPVELMGRTEMPTIGEQPYLLMLGGHSFYWLSLEQPPADAEADAAARYRPPVIEAASPQVLLHGPARAALEEALPDFLYTRRWFARRRADLTSARIDDVVELPEIPLHLLIVRVEYASAEPERFMIPLGLTSDGHTAPPAAVIATLRTPAGDGQLIDAAEDSTAARGLFGLLQQSARTSGSGSLVEATTFGPIERPEGDPLNISVDHTAAALRYDDRYLLKLFRRIEDGVSPELEVTRFLNERAPTLVPRVAGALQLRRARGEPSTLAVLQSYVRNEGSAWTHALEELRRFFERVLTRHRDTPLSPMPRRLLEAARGEMPPALYEAVGPYVEVAALLGRRTAEMHLALASEPTLPEFRPEPYSILDSRSKYQSLRNRAGRTLRFLRESMEWLPPPAASMARELIAHPERVLKAFAPLLGQKLTAARIRTHGDYHLNQVLSTGKDFVIIDFEGPGRETLDQRRRKHSAFRDVASMIRSFHYAALSAMFDPATVRDLDRDAAAPWAEGWYRSITAAFLRTYLDVAADAPFVPKGDQLSLTLDVHVIGRALHELHDELAARSDAVAIPLAGLLDLLA